MTCCTDTGKIGNEDGRNGALTPSRPMPNLRRQVDMVDCTRTCEQCGEDFSRPPRRGPAPRFCTERCQKRASYEREPRFQQSRSPKPSQQCAVCAAWFTPQRRTKQYCSRRCGAAAWGPKWRKANPDKAKAAGSNYIHRRRSAGGAGLSAEQWEGILASFNYCCAYCGANGQQQRDHVVPLSRGGLHDASNVVPACGSCNASKGAKLLSEWRPELVGWR